MPNGTQSSMPQRDHAHIQSLQLQDVFRPFFMDSVDHHYNTSRLLATTRTAAVMCDGIQRMLLPPRMQSTSLLQLNASVAAKAH